MPISEASSQRRNRFGVVEILDDQRHRRLPGAARQTEPAREFGVPGIEFEHVGGAVIAVDQTHFVRNLEIVVPELDGADMLLVVTAKQHQHPGEEFACEHRKRHAAGQAGFLRGIGALEIGIGKFREHDRMAGGPGLAGQPLAIGEHGAFAERAKFGERLAAETAAILQPGSRTVRHPHFNHANEGLHSALLFTAATASIGDFRASGTRKLRAASAQKSGACIWNPEPLTRNPPASTVGGRNQHFRAVRPLPAAISAFCAPEWT